MDLLRIPWNGGQGRPQFPLDHLFRRDDRGVPDRGGAAIGADGDNQMQQVRGGGGGNAAMKVTSPLQKVLDGTFTILMLVFMDLFMSQRLYIDSNLRMLMLLMSIPSLFWIEPSSKNILRSERAYSFATTAYLIPVSFRSRFALVWLKY